MHLFVRFGEVILSRPKPEVKPEKVLKKKATKSSK